MMKKASHQDYGSVLFSLENQSVIDYSIMRSTIMIIIIIIDFG